MQRQLVKKSSDNEFTVNKILMLKATIIGMMFAKIVAFHVLTLL